MGEVADMMLEGILCAGCGDYMDGEADGFPVYCYSCRKDMKRDTAPMKSNQPIAKALLKRLQVAQAATDNPCGMYPGIYFEDAPTQIRKLIARGLLEEYQPHNPVHKLRATITDKGRAVLANYKS